MKAKELMLVTVILFKCGNLVICEDPESDDEDGEDSLSEVFDEAITETPIDHVLDGTRILEKRGGDTSSPINIPLGDKTESKILNKKTGDGLYFAADGNTHDYKEETPETTSTEETTTIEDMIDQILKSPTVDSLDISITEKAKAMIEIEKPQDPQSDDKLTEVLNQVASILQTWAKSIDLENFTEIFKKSLLGLSNLTENITIRGEGNSDLTESQITDKVVGVLNLIASLLQSWAKSLQMADFTKIFESSLLDDHEPVNSEPKKIQTSNEKDLTNFELNEKIVRVLNQVASTLQTWANSIDMRNFTEIFKSSLFESLRVVNYKPSKPIELTKSYSDLTQSQINEIVEEVLNQAASILQTWANSAKTADFTKIFKSSLLDVSENEPTKLTKRSAPQLLETASPSGSFLCPHTGLFRLNNSCTKYYECRFSPKAQKLVPLFRSCPKCLKFNAEENICDLPENVPECSILSSKSGKVCTGPGLFPIPNDCRGYYECQTLNDTVVLTVKKCPPLTVFSQGMGKCVQKKKCNRKEPKCVPGKLFLSDKFNCRVYYHCNRDNRAVPLVCPKGFVFNGHFCEKWEGSKLNWLHK